MPKAYRSPESVEKPLSYTDKSFRFELYDDAQTISKYGYSLVVGATPIVPPDFETTLKESKTYGGGSASNTNQNVNVYTCPAGRVFYVQTISIHILSGDALGSTTFTLTTSYAGINLYISTYGTAFNVIEDRIILTFPVPLRLVAGDIISWSKSAALAATTTGCCVFGFEETA